MTKTITLKNIPIDLYNLIKQNAAINQRSITSEIIAIIEQTLVSKKLSPDDFLDSAKRLREKTQKTLITDDFIYKAKNEGRL
jgi:hypothetical protein